MNNPTIIRVFSHGLAVKPADGRVKQVLMQFALKTAQWEYRKTPPSWKVQKKIVRVFAGATKSRNDFRFHRNQLDELIRHLDANGIGKSRLVIKNMDLPNAQSISYGFKMPPPRDYQVKLIDHLGRTDLRTKVTKLQTGKGKEMSLNSLIKIPNGWKRMGDMEVGDEVIAWDGTIANVIGVYPQGVKQLYRVTFADGRSTLVGAEHLWKVYYINTVPHQRWKVVDTMEMLRLISMPNPRVYIPLCESEKNDDVYLPIDPYVLGVILGDGCISQPPAITISKLDKQLFETVSGRLPDSLKLTAYTDGMAHGIHPVTKGVNPYRDALHEMELFGCLSYNKFIPIDYLYASTNQRLALLQGLMDTDGTVNKIDSGGSVSYSTTSDVLAIGVQYLVRSLGGIASISTRTPTYTYKGEKLAGRLAYNVNIRFKTPSQLFKLDRKQVRTNDDNQYAKGLKLRVVSIVPESIEEAQCIEIDHPDKLYVTDDFIVTHNTFCGLSAINVISKRALLQLRGGYVERWLTDIKEFMTPGKNELMVIRGSGPLKSVINAAKMGEFPEETKLIIITTGTLHSFLKEYEANGKDNVFGIEPQELYELLKIGVVLIDETHEGYHLNYRSDIYRNVESVIHLSATLDTEDRFRRMIYDILYPSEAWAPEVEYDAYIEVTAVKYHAYTPTRYQTTRRGSDMYSHAAFEEVFLKCDKTFNMYMTIILDRIMEQYIKTHKPGQKMLLFFSLTELCDKAANWLKKKLTDLDICVFISGCSEELFSQNDIIVTTIESCGTARDIPDLVYAMLTRNVMRLEANEQIKGRLRKIKRWPEMAPKFDYLVCMSIPKHVEYHEAKINQFKGKVATHDEVISNYHLP